MQETKQRWGKPGGILGYHVIHSYAPGEVTPEQAHEIGVEFAAALLGGSYEAVISTHLDRDHLHCHIVFNSVSLLDGRKYRSNKRTYGLLVLFFAMGVFSSASSFKEMQRPEFALRFFIRFAAAKIMVGHAMEIMLAVFEIVGGVVSTAMNSIVGGVSAAAHLPAEIVAAIDDLSFLESIPLWLVSLLGTLLVTVLSFVLILTVYGRFFRLYVYTAVAPLPMATFAGEGTSQHGKAFLKSYTGVCVEGVVIVLACMIYNAFLSGSAYAVDTTASAVTMCWEYLGEMVFNMLILVGLVRGASRIAKEMFGL